MSIFKQKPDVASTLTHREHYTKDMLTQTEIKEASRRFTPVMRAYQEHINGGSEDLEFINLLKEMAIKRVYTDRKTFRL